MLMNFRLENIAQFLRKRNNVQSIEIFQDAVIAKFTCPIEDHSAVLIVKPFLLFSYQVYSVDSVEKTVFWTPFEFHDYVHFVNENICAGGEAND